MAGGFIWTTPNLLTAPDPEAHIVRWISNVLFAGAVFFDIGAHYGWTAMAAAKEVGRSGRVVAFEPSPVLINILRCHKRMNGLRQLEIVGKAVSHTDSPSTSFFLLNGGLSFRNSLTIGQDDTPYIRSTEKTMCEVESITLDHFVSSSGMIPDAIKIDVEGAELYVLRGARRTIARYRPALLLGIHPYWLPRSQTVRQIFDFLDRYEYEIQGEHIVQFENSYLADYLLVQRNRMPLRSTAARAMTAAESTRTGRYHKFGE